MSLNHSIFILCSIGVYCQFAEQINWPLSKLQCHPAELMKSSHGESKPGLEDRLFLFSIPQPLYKAAEQLFSMDSNAFFADKFKEIWITVMENLDTKTYYSLFSLFFSFLFILMKTHVSTNSLKHKFQPKITIL